jgi:hypothetical protein
VSAVLSALCLEEALAQVVGQLGHVPRDGTGRDGDGGWVPIKAEPRAEEVKHHPFCTALLSGVSCRGEMPARVATWSSSRDRELVLIAAATRSRWLSVRPAQVEAPDQWHLDQAQVTLISAKMLGV